MPGDDPHTEERGLVTFSRMVDYVTHITDPINQHIDAHDAWHLGRLQGQVDERRRSRGVNIQNTVASAALLVSAVALILAHWH